MRSRLFSCAVFAAMTFGSGLIVNGDMNMNAIAGGTELPKVTENDADLVKDALFAAIEKSGDPDIRSLASEIHESAAWVDSSGMLYIGQWRLDDQTNRLIKRPLRARTGPVFEADLLHTDTGWSVGEITVGRQVAPR